MTTEAVPGQAEGRSPAAVGVFALVLLGLAGYLPSSLRAPLTIPVVAVLMGVAVGLPLLVGLARRGDRPAWTGLAFAAWAVVAALASGQALAWTGEYFSATGAVFTAGIVAYWAIGRVLPGDAVPAVAAGFLTGAVLNAAVGVAQGFVDLSAAELSLYDGRSTGLMGNPVFLGALCAAAVPLLPVLLRRSLVGAVPVAFLLAAATQMSGSRNSIVVLVAAGIWLAVRCGPRAGAVIGLALVLGLAAGNAWQGQGDSTAAARLQSAEGVGSRLDNWRAGVEAALERPITGYGPGRWRAATSAQRTLEVARQGPDRLYADAHNLAVEYLATTGFVGLLLLAAWLALVASGLRRLRSAELAVAALALLAAHAVEPQHMALTPIMLLLAGAAGPRVGALGSARPVRVAQAVLVVVAVVLGGRVVAGDLVYRGAKLDFDLHRMRQAASLLRPWPEPVVDEARIHAFRARTEKDQAELRLALATARRARELEPANPLRTIAVAAFLGQLGRHEEAATEYAAALDRNPWSRQALTGRADELRILGRTAEASACRTASQVERLSDARLEVARRRCLGADAKRERP